MDGSQTRSVDFVTLGVLHPGIHQRELRRDASAFSIDMAQWLDGLLWWEIEQRKKELHHA